MNQSNKFQITGRNIYRDKKGNALYYQKDTKRAYFIKSDKEGLFQTLSLRHYISIVVGLLIYFTIIENIFIAVGATIILYAFLEFQYRKFLSSCIQKENFNIQKNTKKVDQEYTDESNRSLLGKTAFFLIIGILLIVNRFISQDIATNQLAQFASYAAAAVSFYFSFRVISIYFQKNKS